MKPNWKNRTLWETYQDILKAVKTCGQNLDDIRRLLEDQREFLGLSSGSEEPPDNSQTISRTRRTGEFAFVLHGKRFTEKNLKEAYRRCLLELSKGQSEFFQDLSTRPIKTRWIVARQPKDLYEHPNMVRDCQKYAASILGGWYADTNQGRLGIVKRLKIACEVAKIQFGQDLILEFPSRSSRKIKQRP